MLLQILQIDRSIDRSCFYRVAHRNADRIGKAVRDVKSRDEPSRSRGPVWSKSKIFITFVQNRRHGLIAPYHCRARIVSGRVLSIRRSLQFARPRIIRDANRMRRRADRFNRGGRRIPRVGLGFTLTTILRGNRRIVLETPGKDRMGIHRVRN